MRMCYYSYTHDEVRRAAKKKEQDEAAYRDAMALFVEGAPVVCRW